MSVGSELGMPYTDNRNACWCSTVIVESIGRKEGKDAGDGNGISGLEAAQ